MYMRPSNIPPFFFKKFFFTFVFMIYPNEYRVPENSKER